MGLHLEGRETSEHVSATGVVAVALELVYEDCIRLPRREVDAKRCQRTKKRLLVALAAARAAIDAQRAAAAERLD
jgi:hypothetical protein